MLKSTKGALLLASVIILWGAINPVKAQDYKFHSLFIYNFTKYIEWPESYKSGDFVIGVLGKSDIIENLQKMAEIKTVGSQKIQVQLVEDVSAAPKCHMFFIPQGQSGKLEDALAAFGGKPTLLISERAGLGKKGSGINFILEQGKWRFELNKSAIESSSLKVSGELVKLGKLI